MDPPHPQSRVSSSCRDFANGDVDFPFIYVPPEGNNGPRFIPTISVAELYARHPTTPLPPYVRPPPFLHHPTTPLPPPPLYVHPPPFLHQPPPLPYDTNFVPHPSLAHYIAAQQPSSTFGQPSIAAAYSSSLQTPAPCLSPSLGQPFLRRKKCDWGIDFYIRIDHAGYFHTYPHVGGPFQSLHDADNAIERYLHDRRDPKMFTMDNVSPVDIAVRQRLYWPDGTRKKRSRSQPMDEIRDSKRQLVHALVDKYNEDHNLLGDLAYELKDVVHYQAICEGDFCKWYYHINFTAKTKGAAELDYCGIDSLFFAEVIYMQGKPAEFPVSCLCLVKPTDNGICYGCTNNGSVDMKHPNDVGYAGGHVMNAFSPFGGPKTLPRDSDDDDDLKAEEDRLRRDFQGRRTYNPCQ